MSRTIRHDKHNVKKQDGKVHSKSGCNCPWACSYRKDAKAQRKARKAELAI